MLTINPAKRITAQEALKHPWVCVSPHTLHPAPCCCRQESIFHVNPPTASLWTSVQSCQISAPSVSKHAISDICRYGVRLSSMFHRRAKEQSMWGMSAVCSSWTGISDHQLTLSDMCSLSAYLRWFAVYKSSKNGGFSGKITFSDINRVFPAAHHTEKNDSCSSSQRCKCLYSRSAYQCRLKDSFFMQLNTNKTTQSHLLII